MSPDDARAPFEVLARVELRQPVLVVALDGWIDAGFGAAAAIAALCEQFPCEPIVQFDLERFVDLRARRPTAHLVDGVNTGLTWPLLELSASADADLLVLTGPEPDFAWATFVDAVVGLAVRYGVRQVVGFGAFPAPAPHTRPVKLAATAPPGSAGLIAQVGVVQGELEVPAGILSALEVGLGDAGIPEISLWARVPHYVAGMAFPDAAAALLDGLRQLSGLPADATSLRTQAIATRDQIDGLIAANAEHRAMVRQLEQSLDASEGTALGTSELPSGDELAAELERFLRGEDRP
jgi:predicted ATP-grasp superfamily ATP-dependent carboligase